MTWSCCIVDRVITSSRTFLLFPSFSCTIVDLHVDPYFFVLTTFFNTSLLLDITKHYVPQPFPSDSMGLRKASFDHGVVAKFAAIVETQNLVDFSYLLFIFLCFILRGEFSFVWTPFQYWSGSWVKGHN